MKIIPNYHPPSDYRRPTKTQEKVYVPVNDYPEINFSTITNPILTHFFLSIFLFGDACGIPWRMQHLSPLTHYAILTHFVHFGLAKTNT